MKVSKQVQWKKLLGLYKYLNNHHGAEILVIWLVERIAIKLLILFHYKAKTNVEVQRI